MAEKPKVIPDTKMLEVGTSNVCNLRCKTCVRNWEEYRKVPPVYLALSQFVLILSRFSALKIVQFCGFSEPTLNKDIPEMIRHAKERGVPHVEMFTNGTRLVGDVARKIAGSGLGLLRVSIDGGDKETYFKSRGANLDKVLSNVAKFATDSGIPVRVESVLSQSTFPSAHKLPQVAAAAHATQLAIRPLDGQDARVHVNRVSSLDGLKKLKTQLLSSCGELGIKLVMPLPGDLETQNHCTAWEEVYVSEEGYFYSCYLLQRQIMGNLLTESLEEIKQRGTAIGSGDYFKNCSCNYALTVRK